MTKELGTVVNISFDMAKTPAWPTDFGRLFGSSWQKASTSVWIKASYPVELQHHTMISKNAFR